MLKRSFSASAWEKHILLHYDYNALLVALLVGLLVFVLFEVPFFAVVQVMLMVVLTFFHALLVLLGFRIIFRVLSL